MCWRSSWRAVTATACSADTPGGWRGDLACCTAWASPGPGRGGAAPGGGAPGLAVLQHRHRGRADRLHLRQWCGGRCGRTSLEQWLAGRGQEQPLSAGRNRERLASRAVALPVYVLGSLAAMVHRARPGDVPLFNMGFGHLAPTLPHDLQIQSQMRGHLIQMPMLTINTAFCGDRRRAALE